MNKKENSKNIRSNNTLAHLKYHPKIYIRKNGALITAPTEDQSVAQSYQKWWDKGPIVDGKRITILSRKSAYQVNEEVRIIHVFEVVEPEHEMYVMGPKPIYGEYLDNELVKTAPPIDEYPFMLMFYNGIVIPSPAVDYNYEITSYKFNKHETHQIYWKLGSLKSNILKFNILETD